MKEKKKRNYWVIKAFLLTLVISTLFSLLANSVLPIAPLWVSCILIFLFILLGVVSDCIATAVPLADAAQFNSMASRRVKGGRTAVTLIHNADKVANICGDIIGDICSIISGSAVALLIESMANLQLPVYGLMILLSAFISAMTVGMKAIGKAIAISNANDIVYRVALGLKVFSKEKI